MAEEGAFSLVMVHGDFPTIDEWLARLDISRYRQEVHLMLLEKQFREQENNLPAEKKNPPYWNDRFVEVLSDC